MTYGGHTYGGAALGSTATTDVTILALATATTTATTTVQATGAVSSTARATTAATTTATGTGQVSATADTQTTASATTTSAGTAESVATATTSATTTATDATTLQPNTEWRVTRDGTDVEDAVYDIAPVEDTANPFGDFAVIKIDDESGEKFEEYGRGTRVDVAVSENFGITFKNRFTGYVVERRETEQSGADALEVEAYSFDQFLRRNTVTNDQRGNTIDAALQDIITTDTPVSYVASNINIGDNQELTRSYQGVKVEEVLRDLAFKSNNEEFGVNDSLEFFFRPRETQHIDRGIDNTQWFNYDIPELGKQAINEVEVWFNGGDESVIVDDGTDKLDLQDSLGLADPGTQRAELNRPLLTDISDAEDVGRKYLQFRNATLSGTVTTFGLYDAEPGDTIDITIQPRGIDTEFVIAAISYTWGVDETQLTIVEKRGEQDGILTELNDSVQRVEMNGADRDAPSNRVTTTNAGAIVDVSVDADGNTPTGVRFVNDGRRAVRDGWADKGYPDISNLVVGDGGGGLSRSNTVLNNQTASASVTESLPDSTSVEYSATVTQTGVEELGLETSDGTLIARAVFDAPVDLAGTVTVALDVSNDASVSRGVLTVDGQTAVRDVLADNTPTIPNEYGYGSDGTAVAESDAALGNEVITTSLEEILIQDASTQSEWDAILPSITATDAYANSSGPTLLQTCFTQEGELPATGNIGFSDGAKYSGNGVNTGEGEAANFANGDEFAEYEFTVDYDIPAGNQEIAVRYSSSGASPVELAWSLDGTQFSTFNVGRLDGSVVWDNLGDFDTIPEIEAGDHTLRVEVTDDSPSDAWILDVVAPHDDRFSYTFDDTPTDGTDGGRYLSGPQLFPADLPISFITADTRRNVTTANFDLTANDASNNFYVELANDGSTFTRINNSQTGSVTFAGPESGVDTNINLSRYGTRTNATPTEGFNGQVIESWNLSANPDAVVSDNINATNTRAVVPPNTITGETIREAGLKSSGTLLTRHEIAEFTLETGQRLASSESTAFKGDE